MERKLNICIVAREYPPETLWGGIGTFTYNLAHGLKNIGHNVDVVAFTLGRVDTHIVDDGINVYRISSPMHPYKDKTLWDSVTTALFPFAVAYSLKVRTKIKQLDIERHYDVIDVPEHIGEGFFTILTNKYATLVRLFTPLSLIGHLGLQRATNIIDYYLLGIMEKASIKRATIINSPSKALADLVKKEFGIKRDIELIYNPIDTDKFSPRPVCRKDKGEIRVLFVGRLEDRKGAHILARAIPEVARACENVKFSILGNDCKGVEGFTSMKDFMFSIFKERGVMENVEFLDRVPYEKLPAIYNMADISVVPSLYDNSPYTCLEAMSCGLPVIGTSAGGMPEYIDDGVNGIIVPPNDVKALSAALILLALEPHKRKAFASNAREKAVREFKREEVAHKITRVYFKAITLFENSKEHAASIPGN